MVSVEPLMRRNFLEYASYVVVDRAIPELMDGLKPVQRRILHTLHGMDDGRLHKVANVIGETMKLHPHGDASIGDALVVLANKDYFIERQGNFGSILTGHPAAAARYIECRLTPLARETLFHPDLTTYAPSYDGRRREPVALPAKLPVVLLLGIEGIAVGMATHILPHNFCELLRAQIAILEKKKFTIQPDFRQGGLMDVAEYADGRGRVRVRARIDTDKDGKTVTIREIPYGTTTESLIASMESAAQKGKVKISSIEDRTGEKVEIVIHLSRGTYAEEVVPQLYAYTDCEQSITSSLVVIRDRRPVELTVSEILHVLTAQLRSTIQRELEVELGKLEDRHHAISLERIFIEKRVYKRIEDAKTEEAVLREVHEGLRPHVKQLARAVTDEDVARLLAIPIRRISAWDIEKNRRDLESVDAAIATCQKKLKRLTPTTIAYLEDLLKRYGDAYPRRTKVGSFEVVDKRAVARQHLRVSYDPETGFFGTAVRGSEHKLSVSEFDKIIAVCRDGTYRIITAPEKLLLPEPVLHLDLFNEQDGQKLTVIYRDARKIPWAKKVHITGFIRDKEYELVKGREGRVDIVLPGFVDRKVHLGYAPKKGLRIKEGTFDLATLEPCGVGARGTRIGPKPVSRVKLLS